MPTVTDSDLYAILTTNDGVLTPETIEAGRTIVRDVQIEAVRGVVQTLRVALRKVDDAANATCRSLIHARARLAVAESFAIGDTVAIAGSVATLETAAAEHLSAWRSALAEVAQLEAYLAGIAAS